MLKFRRHEMASALGGKVQKIKLTELLINIAVWGFFILSFIWMSKALLIGGYPDFQTQYYVPKLILQGVNPYIGSPLLHTPQVYPPTIILLYFFFAFIPLSLASQIFTLLSIVCLLMSLFFLSSIFKVGFFSKLNLLLAGFVFISFPVKFTLGMGQINLFILLLLTFALFFLTKKKEFIAGIFLGLTIVLKFFPMIFPVYLLFTITKDTKRIYKNRFTWRAFFEIPIAHIKIWLKPKQVHAGIRMIKGFLTVIFVSMILVFIFIPFELSHYFATKILPSLFTSWKLDYYNQALSGFIGRSFGTDIFANVLKMAFSSVITLAALFVIVKNESEDALSIALKFGTIVTASLLINTFSWQHHFVWLIIPFYASLFYLRESAAFSNKKRNIYYILLFISYFLVSINFKDPNVLPVVFQSHVFYGALILLSINLRLLLKNKF